MDEEEIIKWLSRGDEQPGPLPILSLLTDLSNAVDDVRSIAGALISEQRMIVVGRYIAMITSGVDWDVYGSMESGVRDIAIRDDDIEATRMT